MRTDATPRLPTMLGRALRRRCPRCAQGRIFRSWFDLVEACPGCGLRFERDPGYWVGAMIVNTVAVTVAFLVVFVGGMAVTWPDVPWTALTVATVAVSAFVPIVFYPYAKTIWLALDLRFRPEP